MFSRATEWDMVERNPFDRGKPLIVKENNKRYRYLDEDEIGRLLESCPSDYTRNAVACVLHTGMRRQEVLGLKWEQIRGDFIYLSKTKTDEARQVPIDDDLAELFKTIRKRNQLTTEYRFCDKQGRPFKDLKTSFRAACKKAGSKIFAFMIYGIASQVIL